MRFIHILAACLILLSQTICANELVVRHVLPKGDPAKKSHYAFKLLTLALEKTIDSHGPYRLQSTKTTIPQDRAILSLSRGKELDVVWSVTSSEREDLLLPVRIPLRKGLLGYRVLIINKESEKAFSSVETVEDLMRFKAGQGHDWPDVDILKANNLSVVTSPNYEGLFKMLNVNRFDYFPRGIYEAPPEIEDHPDFNLMIEKRIIIKYFSPIFFFTSKNNQQLAERLEYGLRLAIKDGDFNKLLYSTREIQTLFKIWDLENRKILHLDNPLLTPETAALLNEKELWYVSGEELKSE